MPWYTKGTFCFDVRITQRTQMCDGEVKKLNKKKEGLVRLLVRLGHLKKMGDFASQNVKMTHKYLTV